MLVLFFWKSKNGSTSRLKWAEKHKKFHVKLSSNQATYSNILALHTTLYQIIILLLYWSSFLKLFIVDEFLKNNRATQSHNSKKGTSCTFKKNTFLKIPEQVKQSIIHNYVKLCSSHCSALVIQKLKPGPLLTILVKNKNVNIQIFEFHMWRLNITIDSEYLYFYWNHENPGIMRTCGDDDANITFWLQCYSKKSL